MKKINQKEIILDLEKQGFSDIRVCPIEPGFDSGEHTHDEHTVHVILSGELTIQDQNGKITFIPGDTVEFPAGTTHKAFGMKNESGSMIVGVKSKKTQFPKTSAPALRALQGAGFNYLEDLTSVSEKELSKLHGMGPKALQILKQALKDKKLSFQD